MLLTVAIGMLDGSKRIETITENGSVNVVWVDNLVEIATGFYNDEQYQVSIGRNTFIGMSARTLLLCGKLVTDMPPDILSDQGFQQSEHLAATHHNVLDTTCDDCPHLVHLGICTHILNGRKCGCEYVNP